MRLQSVNVGKPAPDAGRRTKTGIRKKPVTEALVGELGLAGDAVCNKRHHGGRDQAVYLYAAEDYAWWSGELGRQLAPGTFGENLTTEGLDATGLAVGDRLRLGEVELEVTAPRIPCATLERRMEIEGFVARFLAAQRPGAYLRVLRPGTLRTGDGITLTPYAGERIGMVELSDGFHRPVLTEEAIRRVLAAPVAERLRAMKEGQLARVLSTTR